MLIIPKKLVKEKKWNKNKNVEVNSRRGVIFRGQM